LFPHFSHRPRQHQIEDIPLKVALSQNDPTRYELSPGGISLPGYVVRHMQKTEWLLHVPALIANGNTDETLACVAMCAVKSSTTVGLRGPGMPAPSKIHFQSGSYSNERTLLAYRQSKQRVERV
jgi:hypothetical protein